MATRRSNAISLIPAKRTAPDMTTLARRRSHPTSVRFGSLIALLGGPPDCSLIAMAATIPQ
jgi:hypothetical protein